MYLNCQLVRSLPDPEVRVIKHEDRLHDIRVHYGTI